MSTATPITADPPRRRGGGPKTEAGKRRASMNAVKHGMYAAAVVLPGESQQEYDALLARYLDRFRPTSPDQEHLVHTLVNADWRIKRLVYIQTTKLAERIERQPNEGRDPATQAYSFEVRHSQALLTADKHEARLQRDYDRALRRLLEIEKRRTQSKNQRNELETAQAGGLHRSAPFDAPPQPDATLESGPQRPTAPLDYLSPSERTNSGNEQSLDTAGAKGPLFSANMAGATELPMTVKQGAPRPCVLMPFKL